MSQANAQGPETPETEEAEFMSEEEAAALEEVLKEEAEALKTEEKSLTEKAQATKGESKLAKKDAVRLVALRYMLGANFLDKGKPARKEPLSEEDAMQLAELEWEAMHSASQEWKGAKTEKRKYNPAAPSQIMVELRKKLEKTVG